MSRLSALRDEYRDDPLSRGYSTMTAAEYRDSLRTVNRTVVRSLDATPKTLLANLAPSDAAAILDSLDGAKGNNSVVKWTMAVVNNLGIDLGHANTRSQVDALVNDGVLTSAQGTALKQLAEETVSRAEEIGAPEPLLWECEHAIQEAS